MKRAREIDLEAPVLEDEDGEDDGDDASTSSLERRFFSKKSRWLQPRGFETSVRPGGLESPTGADNERHCRWRTTDDEVRGVGSKDLRDDATATTTAYPRPFAGFGLLMFMGSEVPESRGTEGQQKPKIASEFLQNSTGINNLEGAEIGKEVERTISEQCEACVEEGKRTFASPPAVLLHAIDEFPDAALYSVFRKLGVLLSQAEPNARLEAICCISTRVELLKDTGLRRSVAQIIQQQLWKEDEHSIIQALVKVLCSVAVMSCGDFKGKEEKDLDLASSQAVASSLLQYITTKDLTSSPLNSGLKVQILRSLYLIGKAGCSLEVESFGALAKEQLGSSNPRLREWGIRLLVQSIKERNASIVVEGRDLNETRVDVSQRVRMGWAEGESLMHSLLEYARDPYPSVREAVVWAMLKMHGRGFSFKPITYKLACTLLQDPYETVRISAIKLVAICVKQTAWDVFEAQARYVDDAFMQICNKMTDMIMHVRQEALNTLADMTGVSDSVLLQSLSKKVLTSAAEKEPTAGSSTSRSDGSFDIASLEENNLLDWSVAGAFVVGLEDEYWEVRSAAIKALAKLGISSEKLAQGALGLMVDMINDDSSHVRQQTICSLTNLALEGCLYVSEEHLYMVHDIRQALLARLHFTSMQSGEKFLGILEDSNTEMRKSGLAFLSAISFPSITTFQLTIRAVLTSLEKYPEDTETVLITLVKLGKLHASHTECMAIELVRELRGLLCKEPGLDEPRCVAVLMLLLGAGITNQKILSLIPPQIIPLSSLVSKKLSVILPSLQFLPKGFKTLEYVCYMKDGALPSEKYNKQQSREAGQYWSSINISKHAVEYIDLESGGHEGSWKSNVKTDLLNLRRKKQTIAKLEGSHGSHRNCYMVARGYQQNKACQLGEIEFLRSADQILSRAVGTRLLLDSKGFKEVLQRLSGCRREIISLKGKCPGLAGTVSFCGLYLQCLTLVAQLRANFATQESLMFVKKLGLPHNLLNELDLAVKHILHRFVGLTFEQILQVLELLALVSVWRLALHQLNCPVNGTQTFILLKLRSVVATAEKVIKSMGLPPSALLSAVQEHLFRQEGKANLVMRWRTARQLALSYWPSQLPVTVSLEEMSAYMKTPGSNFNHPVRFIPGLPLGIPIDVTVYNVPNTCSLWIQFVRDNSAAQYKFLDTRECGTASTGNFGHFSTILQLDQMPPVASSICRVCIVLEAVDQGFHLEVEPVRGPKGSLVPLCIEMEVHLLVSKGRGSKQVPHGRR